MQEKFGCSYSLELVEPHVVATHLSLRTGCLYEALELVGSRGWPWLKRKPTLEFLELGGGSSRVQFSWKLEHGVDLVKWLAGCL